MFVYICNFYIYSIKDKWKNILHFNSLSISYMPWSTTDGFTDTDLQCLMLIMALINQESVGVFGGEENKIEKVISHSHSFATYKIP